MRTLLLRIMIALCVSVTPFVYADTSAVFNVPRVDGIVIDGRSDDWGDRGFHVGLMTDPSGKILPSNDFDPKFRLGWSDRGLFVLVTVRDDTAVEASEAASMWTKDCILPFVARRRGGSEYYGTMVAPGIAHDQPELRTSFFDRRAHPATDAELTVEAARTKTTGGYAVEILLPWKNLGPKPEQGEEIGFQMIAADADGETDWFTATWYPSIDAHANSSAMHRIRLADKPSPPVVARAGVTYERFRRTRVTVTAASELAGKTVTVQHGGATLVSGKLEAENGRVVANLFFPMPAPGQVLGQLAINVDGGRVTTCTPADADATRARAFIDEAILFEPYCFADAALPGCEFEHYALVEQLIGPYTINTTYYDARGELVSSAREPGRYAAVVEIQRQDGRVSRRFRTLFRQPASLDWWRTEVEASIELPKQLGISPAVAGEHSAIIGDYLKWRFADGLNRDLRGAALLAGLYEMDVAPDDTTSGDADPSWCDRQWWVTFKRRFYGAAKAYPDSFVCPRPIGGGPAPVVREGSPAEAGMKPGVAARIDAVCEEWANESDEAFAVCVVRHGVVVLHKAYGRRDGKPMTVTTESWMASITKLLSGTLMMELVDQGLVDLDDRVDKFIPALRDIQVTTPLTIRHLYTHTCGLWGHWGDDMNDFEEVIADYYPHLEVGVRHEYNGAGYALGGKVIEMVTGEAIPQFYRKHLLDPLGCTNTRVEGTSGDARSVPLDIARIGQMLLNRGAYGDMRFFSEETFQKMLPQPLTKLLGPDTALEWGIGTVWMRGDGLGERTFGHGAASAAILRIDPASDMVIVQTRNTAGENYYAYAQKFFGAIIDGIEDGSK